MTKKQFDEIMVSVRAEIEEEKKTYFSAGKTFEPKKIYIGMSRLLYFEMVQAAANHYGIFIDYSAPLLYGHPVRIIEGIETGFYLMKPVPIFMEPQEETQ